MKAEKWVLAFAMLLPAAASAIYFVFLSGKDSASDSNPVMQVGYAASKIIQFSLPIVWLGIADRSALRLRRVTFGGVGLGLAFGIATAIFTWIVYLGWLVHSPALEGVPERIRAKVAEFGASSRAGFIALAGFIAIVHSLLEEYYWRWFVFGRLRRHVPIIVAIVTSSLAFMFHHIIVLAVYFPGWFWSVTMPFCLAIAFGGMFWAWLYQRSGSLMGPWVSHLIVDVAIMAIGYDLVFG